MRDLMRVPDHLLVCLQANCDCRRSSRKKSAEPIFVRFAMMGELPVFQRTKRERQAGSVAKDLFIATEKP